MGFSNTDETARTVSIVSSRYERAYQDLSRVINLAGGLGLKDRDKVIIKINLCDFRTPETGAVTHPLFLEATLRHLRENYQNLKIYVVESDATVALPDLFVKWFGLLPIIQKWNAIWCNLSKQRTLMREINGRYFQKMNVPEIFEDGYFMTLPKMKTSSVTKVSCALKNQFGCLPIRKKIKFHPYLDDVIVDVNLAMHPDFCIVDGIIAMGGSQGPTFGVPIPANLILAGRDPVAVDAVCARIMGFNPNSIGHIRKAHESRVGSMNYRTAGKEIQEACVDFEWDPLQSLVMNMGTRLRARVRPPEG
jgi:uncharacterized protein (DUF362 family)